MARPVLSLRAVSKHFRTRRTSVTAVDCIDLDVSEGEIVCLVGESGCGKSTLARIACGLVEPSSGEVRSNGVLTRDMTRRQRHEYRLSTQYIHQDPFGSLNPRQSVRTTLRAPLRRHHKRLGLERSDAVVDAESRRLLDVVGLSPTADFIDKYPHQLSGGQRQRVAIARSVSVKPDVLIADEPVSMIDVSLRVSILDSFRQLRDELGVAIVLITHDLSVARQFGRDGRTLVMYVGEIVEQGPTPTVIDEPEHPYTRALIAATPGSSIASTPEAMGDIPDLRALPAGCRFHPRCPFARSGTCDEQRPLLGRRSAEHSVACHLVEEIAASSPALVPVSPKPRTANRKATS